MKSDERPVGSGDEQPVTHGDAASVSAGVEPDTGSWWRIGAVVVAAAALGWWQGWRLLAVIGALVVMIFLHELGHFVMARRAGMKVTQFFLGFGPTLWSFRRGEVEYGLKAIPGGAFVRIIGMMNVDEVASADESRTYRQQGFWDRIGVAVAGSTMHFALALVLAFSALVVSGHQDVRHWAISAITKGSAADLAGLRIGDQVLAVDGQKVRTFEEMSEEVRRRADQQVDLRVRRDGKVRTVAVLLGGRASVIGTVGQDLALESAGEGDIRAFQTGSSIPEQLRVESAGIEDGDRILAVNGVELNQLADLDRAIPERNQGMFTVTFEHDGQRRTVDLDLGASVAVTSIRGFLGVGQELVPQSVGVGEAAWRSVSTSAQMGAMTVVGVGKVFNPVNLAHFVATTFSNSSSDVADVPTSAEASRAATADRDANRPVSIIGVVGLGAQLDDWGSALRFFAGVNITIGVINLVPLLPFDGGHVAVAVYERIREILRRDRRRYFVDAAKLMPITYGVVLVLVLVMLTSGYRDIVSPIQL